MRNLDIKLRALELKDVELVLEWENDYKEWTNSTNTRFCSKIALEVYIYGEQNRDIYSSEQARFMIDCGSASVGCVDLCSIDPRNSRAAIGIYIDKDFRGAHFATKALQALEEYAHNILCLHQLYAYVSAKNTASVRLFESMGYKSNIILKDWLKIGDEYIDTYLYQKIL